MIRAPEEARSMYSPHLLVLCAVLAVICTVVVFSSGA